MEDLQFLMIGYYFMLVSVTVGKGLLRYLFSPNEQCGGWGRVCCQTFLLFSFPCSADHERDWPPCKVVFFGLAINTLNVRNNNNNNNIGEKGYYYSMEKRNGLFETF